MNDEWFAAIALPVSTADDAGEHVSVFISPKLTPGGTEAPLSAFPVFRDWAERVRAATITLVDQRGEFAATADVSAIDPDLWRAAFDPQTPVRSNTVPTWQQRDWRTFGAKDAADIAKAIHLATVLADPLDPPAPSAHPLARTILTIAQESGALRLPGRGDDRPDWPVYDEGALTDFLDRSLPRGRDGAWTAAAGDIPPVGADDSVGAIMTALLALHRVRRFYERPESQPERQTVKRPPDRVAPLPSPEAEFHERIASAGDHPELLRRLGLLIPLRADPARLRGSTWLAAIVRTDADDDACRSPRLAVQAQPDDTFTSVPNPHDPDIWWRGALALGEPDIFDVIDVDIDGSAIKAERFLTTLPRLIFAERDRAPGDAATPALRSTGLTVTRRQQAGRALTQLQRQEGYQDALTRPRPVEEMPLIHTQDVTRGVRVEVWDSHTRAWRSLHSRLTSLRLGDDVVYTDVLNEGFIQGTTATETPGVADSPVHVHEAMFGWDGWSLSAPRPGRRIRTVISDAPGGGSQIEETPEPTPTAPIDAERPPHPFSFVHRIAEGTLPRLRYGRDYAFRAWAVDLGGTVRAHRLGPRPDGVDAAAIAEALADAPQRRTVTARSASDHLGRVSDLHRTLSQRLVPGTTDRDEIMSTLRTTADTMPDSQPESPSTAAGALLDGLDLDALRSVARAARLGRDATDPLDAALRSPRARVAGRVIDDLRELGPVGAPVHGSGIGAGTSATVDGGAAGRPARAGALPESFRAAREDARRPMGRSTVVTDPTVLADLMAAHLGTSGPVIGHGTRPLRPPLAHALRTVTLPRPFLRWDPVPVPVLVPLRPFTEGESLRVLVIRSGVAQDPQTAAVTVLDPVAYAESVASVAPEYAGVAERHIAPPKTSQLQAELHGVFDRGIDEGTEAARRTMLAWALRESGTFFDQSVPHLTDPAGTPLPQPGIRLVPEPTDATHFNPSDPAHPLKVLPPGPAGIDEHLVLRPGEAPAPGQYVVHETERLALPYLPDPLAVGASLTFVEAGRDRELDSPYGAENLTARYPGSWPDLQPFLLSAAGGPELDGGIDGHRIRIQLPPGDVQVMRVSSSIEADKLEWFGVWRSLDARFTEDPDMREAAADGLVWALTPGERVTIVHAVPRPVMAPRAIRLAVLRALGSTSAALLGAVEVHGPSTEHIAVTVAWTDTVDDVNLDAPTQRSGEAAAFITPVHADETVVPFWPVDQAPSLPGWEGVRLHGSTHAFPDTKHHSARYRLRASTRFREYFAPELLAPDPADPLDDGQSVISDEILLSVPSTARPASPTVHAVLPLFRWGETEEPDQPFGRRRTRGAGVRIYLERPWFSSGDDELLAVLLAVGGEDTRRYPAQPDPADGFPFVSQWGSDPIWTAPGVPSRAVGLFELDDVLSIFDMDDRVRAGRPAAAPATLPLPLGGDTDETVTVVAVGYRPQYSARRRLWFVDVAFDARATFWPFLRLAVARYQPASVAGAHLSTPVRLDQVQLTPERTASVNRTDDRHVRVVVAGIAGHRDTATRDEAASVAKHRRLIGRLQKRDDAIGGDLGWCSIDVVELRMRGRSTQGADLVFVGELGADEPIPVRTPLGDVAPQQDSGWRVRVEEWESFPGDRPPESQIAEYGREPVWEKRLVYADDFYL